MYPNHEAETNASDIADDVSAGAEVVKKLGLLEGRIIVADDFDAPLDDETLGLFEAN